LIHDLVNAVRTKLIELRFGSIGNKQRLRPCSKLES